MKTNYSVGVAKNPKSRCLRVTRFPGLQPLCVPILQGLPRPQRPHKSRFVPFHQHPVFLRSYVFHGSLSFVVADSYQHTISNGSQTSSVARFWCLPDCQTSPSGPQNMNRLHFQFYQRKSRNNLQHIATGSRKYLHIFFFSIKIP